MTETPAPETPEVPEAVVWQQVRGRITAPGHRTDDDTMCTLLVIHETEGSWAIHGLGAPGVRLTNDGIISLAESILERAR